MQGTWAGRTALVTGCGGFLGAWVARLLCQEGARVIGLSRRRAADGVLPHLFSLNDRVTFVSGSVQDEPLLRHIVDAYDVHAVFHLAGQSQVTEARRRPAETFDTNTRGTWTLLEAARLAVRPPAVVVASTEAVYGEGPGSPFSEDAPLLASDPYAVSKACAELIARSYRESYDMRVAVLRTTRLYGGGDLNFSRIVPGTIWAVLNNVAPVLRSDGTATHDYLYAGDAAAAYVLVADRMLGGACGDEFNLGSGRLASPREIVPTILRLMDRLDLLPASLTGSAPTRPGAHVCSDRLGQAYGWQATTSLEDGLGMTVAWYRDAKTVLSSSVHS